MRIILIMIMLLMTGCAGIGGFAPSGLMDYSCEPHCTSKDYYIPSKGHWAKKKTMKKADYGALGGSAIGAAIASSTNDPLIIATAAVTGLVVGHGVGTTLDKIDELHAAMVLTNSLSYNNNGENTSWKHPNKNLVVNAMPINQNGQCREFITSVQVESRLREMRGTACLNNGEWELKEIY